MGKKKRSKKNNKKKAGQSFLSVKKKLSIFALPGEVKKRILAVVIFILAIVILLSFFDLAGSAGSFLTRALIFLIGKTAFIIPLIFLLGGIIFLKAKYQRIFGPTVLAIFILIIGITGLMQSLGPEARQGGWLGNISAWFFLKFFSDLVSKIIFAGIIVIGSLIFWYLIKEPKTKEALKDKESLEIEKKPPLIKKIFLPKFRVKEVEPRIKESQIKDQESEKELKPKEAIIGKSSSWGEYKRPALELLETDKGKAAAGDTVSNCAIIKKTLDNFGLQVEMSEINVGPTVTQYTLKPAEGIKLSKITALSNNLSLALASHPIRIEAPIPGKSLVGIEVPNKTRCQIRLRDLIATPQFQEASSCLNIVLGKDVSGNACYADLARMPHLLVAGSTGTGKTIFLNSLILSLLYQNSPETLRFILIDPKRVEFSAYKDLPHLLTPVIFDAQRTTNALRWLISEMEKRFNILAGNGSRNIDSYNKKIIKEGEKPLSFIVLIVDELADLMAAKGREMEAGIVRLAQMARAVGIHLVVATQRPSVEVITGLIKANITSRVTFQVASQVDSRTILDASGAEKLLGAGDLLFLSAEVSKPKRIQGAYVSEKEVKRVVDYIRAQKDKFVLEQGIDFFENHLAEDLEKSLETKEGEIDFEDFQGQEPLYEEAKRLVIEAKKASASLLQRRLRIGYARAARLLDMLEDQGVIGPGEGAKPREVYLANDNDNNNNNNNDNGSGNDNDNDNDKNDEWQKI